MIDAVIEAATLRLRPILMTTGAMVLGALPLALATGAGAESRTQIGWVIVGGMAFGTLLTLFVVPTAYTLLAGRPRQSRGMLEQPLERCRSPAPPTERRRRGRRRDAGIAGGNVRARCRIAIEWASENGSMMPFPPFPEEEPCLPHLQCSAPHPRPRLFGVAARRRPSSKSSGGTR